MSKPLVQQVCERARGLVGNPRTWTQFAIARAGNNRACELTDKRAVRFCAYGAIVRSAYDVAGTDYAMAVQLADRAAMAITGQHSPLAAFEEIIEINDGPRAVARCKVLALFDMAAAKA